MSTISWLRDEHGRPGRTWNPIRARHRVTGKIGWHCEPVHEGCRYCYAAAQNRAGARGGTRLDYKPGHRADVELFLDEKVLIQPLHWRKPLRIFPCSMTDLYGAWVLDEWIDRIKAVQALTLQHTYIELTKRPERMRRCNATGRLPYRIARRVLDMVIAGTVSAAAMELDCWPVTSEGDPEDPDDVVLKHWPLPNVWGGPSCSTQADADWMIPEVLATPLAKRLISFEPLLGAVDIHSVQCRDTGSCTTCPACLGGLDLAIVGGLNGPAPTEIEHIRSVVRQCRSAGTKVFVKQLGRTCRMDRTDAVQAVALGAGWRADDKDAPLGVVSFRNRKGEDPIEWPEGLRIREWPEVQP